MSGIAAVDLLAGEAIDFLVKGSMVVAAGWLVRLAVSRTPPTWKHVTGATTFAALPLLAMVTFATGTASPTPPNALLFAWAVGVVAFSLPIARGVLAVHRLTRDSEPAVEDGLRFSEDISSPFTWGGFRPVVLLPLEAQEWNAERRVAAILHERIHIRRRDWLVHMLMWICCAVFWFHPLAWHLRALTCEDAEYATDDQVLAAGVRPSTYADLLLSITRSQTVSAAVAAARVDTASRVRAILEPRSRTTDRRPAIFLAFILVLPGISMLFEASLFTPPPARLTCGPSPFEPNAFDLGPVDPTRFEP